MDRFIGEVIDVFDPEQSSRLKIRIFGLHDDAVRIPDSDLPWARCVFPVTNPVHNGVAGPTTGLVKGSTVVGYFADSAKQIPLIDGTLGGVANSVYDFPKIDRGEDFNEVLNTSVISVGTQNLKFAFNTTIATIQFTGQGIEQMLKEVQSGDIIGAISATKDTITNFNNLKNSIKANGLNIAGSAIQSFVSQATSSVSSQLPISSTDIGTIVNTVDSSSGTIPGLSGSLPSSSTIMDSINSLAGSIATRTSKLPINTTQDVITQLNGSRFVMNNIMTSLDSTLSSLASKV
jgi:hypothetical protein